MEHNASKFPQYIFEFFNNIKFQLKNIAKNKEQQKFLKKYDDEKYFMNDIKSCMSESIKRYLGIDVDDDNSDSDSDEELLSSDADELPLKLDCSNYKEKDVNGVENIKEYICNKLSENTKPKVLIKNNKGVILNTRKQ